MPSASLRGIGRASKAPAAPSASAATSTSPTAEPSPTAGKATDDAAADAQDLSMPSDAGSGPPNANASSSSIPAISNGLIVPTTTTNSLSPSSSAASVSEKPSKLGLLSRLNIQLPGRRSNRHVVDFHIRPDEPHKQYASGDSVRGSVVLAIVKPMRITHLVVALHGYVHVFKDPSVVRSQTAAVMPRGGSSALPQYLGNGVASLFQDEQVLSGDGRLEAGRYEFGFDLLFPEKVLPSSIEFERGTISYMITATLTRPTAIAPTISCDRRVILAQQIDVGDVSPPRPRTIFLEPISKRSRKKRTATSERSKLASQQESPSTEVGSEVGTDPSIAGDVGRDSATEHRSGTDGRSEFSGESNRSVSTGMSRSELSTLSNVTSTKQQVVDDKTITATIELLKGGYMPGDAVTVRVTVQHIKHIKSMNGVIVTLYRQGKIDSAPSATLFIGNGDKALDEAYPRSRTGLAGLSISSTSSRSMFRKDLDQNVVPLIIDPITLHATVTVTLKLPDNSFPSIKGVPGGMIGFKYQAEVIVDLGGRLSSQITQGGTSTRYGSFAVNGTEQASVGFGPRTATSIMDTTPLRRQKGVISVSMEFIVGTQDSSRTRKQAALRKRVIRIADGDEQQHLDEPPTPAEHAPPSNNGFANPSPLPTPNSRPPYSPPANNMLPPQAGPSSAPSYPQQQQNGYFNDTVPAYIPRPQLPTENNISEKDRIRQAETRLLPSQPSAPAEASSSSAPPDEDLYSNQDAPHAPPADLLLPSAPLASTEAGPSAPTLDEVVSPTHPTEDKQELERRRLIDEASAPPEVPDDFDEQQHRPDAPSAPDLDNAEPSAPVLNEDDDFEGFGMQAGPSTAGPSTNGEQLPAYQR